MRTQFSFLFIILALSIALMLSAPVHAQPGAFQGTAVVTGTPSPALTATTTLTSTLSPVVASPTAVPTATLFPLPEWTPLPIPEFPTENVLPSLLNPFIHNPPGAGQSDSGALSR